MPHLFLISDEFAELKAEQPKFMKELVSTARIGADYQPDKEDQQIEDHTIYRINDLGQYEILSEDLSGLDNAEDIKQIPTELDAIIDGIHEVAEQEQITPLPRPWLPSL